ncbi:MAG: hypothetical protein JST81_12205 [Bacteroidetes bacterium]|nr:hypothetical protein [Bacteroidota bacterium]
MKKIIFIAFIAASLTACKKENDPVCEKTVTAIAANYKLTKIETVTAAGSSDVTNSLLDNCKKNAYYGLKTDKTFTYTEISSTCTGSGAGTWDVTSSTITITGAGGFDFTNAPIESWDCTNLIITQTINVAGVTTNYRFTFVKQ